MARRCGGSWAHRYRAVFRLDVYLINIQNAVEIEGQNLARLMSWVCSRQGVLELHEEYLNGLIVEKSELPELHR